MNLEAFADRLAAELAPRVAEKVAEIIEREQGAEEPLATAVANRTAGEMLTVAEVAERTGRSHDWVRQHATELGVERIGEGPKPRLYFPPARIEALLSGERNGSGEPEPADPPRRRRQPPALSSEVELLPYEGRRP